MSDVSAKDVRLDRGTIDAILEKYRVDPARAYIRQMVLVVGEAEKQLKTRFLHMEMGVPGLDALPLAAEGEIMALRNPRIPSGYGPLDGVPALKEEAARFLKLFLDLEVPPEYVIPTVGSMHGGFLSQGVAGRRFAERDTILFIDPCFSVHRLQTRFLGLKTASVDLYDRAQWLDRVEALCQKGNIGALLYSSPNNPTWVILTEDEMRRLGEICTKYDVVAIEDAAYFGMDFRRDYSVPGQPPYPPTVARYTENYILLISGSKIFSYAGQRTAFAVLSPALCKREFPGLEKISGFRNVYDAFVFVALYGTTASVPQSPQYGLLALLRKVNRGEYNFLRGVSEYAERAKALKKIMLSHGFRLVYDQDLGEPLADGFYFTFSYPEMDGGQLVRELMYYGISCTTLAITGSSRAEGARACVSMIGKDDYRLFEARIKAFRKDHHVAADKEPEMEAAESAEASAEGLPPEVEDAVKEITDPEKVIEPGTSGDGS
jgi:aspartate/methionine/tyrosine aminotransferase